MVGTNAHPLKNFTFSLQAHTTLKMATVPTSFP
jgi:hypothetical protein